MNRQASCKERIGEQLKDRITDLEKLWKAYQSGEEEVEDLGNFCEYGLAFDYVAKGTFRDQRHGYFRYQLSWGGPSDEFRFYVDETRKPHRIEYWFLDWYDGAKRVLRGRNAELLEEIWQFFDDVGSVDAEFKKGTEE